MLLNRHKKEREVQEQQEGHEISKEVKKQVEQVQENRDFDTEMGTEFFSHEDIQETEKKPTKKERKK